jgi:hypothetical protein
VSEPDQGSAGESEAASFPGPRARRAVSALPTRVRHPRRHLLKFAPRHISGLVMRRNSGYLCCSDSGKPDGAFGIPDTIHCQIGRDDHLGGTAAAPRGPRPGRRPLSVRRPNCQAVKSFDLLQPAAARARLPACSCAPASRNARLNIGMILAKDSSTLGLHLLMSSWSVSKSARRAVFLASAAGAPKKGGALLGPRTVRCWPRGRRGPWRRGIGVRFVSDIQL